MPLICECDSEECAELVRISLVDHAAARVGDRYVVSAGHRFDGIPDDPSPHGYVLYRVI